MRVIVIGAGVAGLGAATLFARRGHSVEVIEASDRVGGRAITVTARSGDRVDAGTQYFHTNYRRARALLRDLGIERGLSPIGGHTRFFDDRVRKGFFDVSHRAPWFPPAGLANLKAAAVLARALLAAAEVFALDYRSNLDEASALDAIQDPRLREFVLRPLLLAGTLAEPEVAAPSLLHALRLLRIVVLTDYLVLPGGTASFHAALAARLPVRLDTPARRLVVENGAVAGVELDGNETVLAADHVVIATPPPAALDLIPGDWTPEREFLAGVTIPSFVLPTFFLDRPLDCNIWSYMLQAGKDHRIGFIIDAARKNPAMVPSGKSAMQAWICRDDRTGEPPSASDMVALCQHELERLFPGFSGWIEDIQLTQHPCAVPFHRVGHQRRAIEFLRHADMRKGVSFCGDYLTGGFMEAALWSAERAAARHA